MKMNGFGAFNLFDIGFGGVLFGLGWFWLVGWSFVGFVFCYGMGWFFYFL